MKLHGEFEWDPKMAASNLKKHKVSFEEAATVLGDPDGDKNHLEDFDDKHSMGEDRYITFGSHPNVREIVLVISWTDRSTEHDRITRIISARPASPRERKRYAKEISAR